MAALCASNASTKQSKPKYTSPKLTPLTLAKAQSQEAICRDFQVRSDSLRRLFDWDGKRLLGSGAFAHVYRATCLVAPTVGTGTSWSTDRLRPGTDYAVKVLPRAFLSADHRQHKNLAHEVAILRHIDHPACLKLYDVFEDPEDAHVALCLELVEGGELLEMLQDHVNHGGHLTEERAREIMSLILEAMAYLHDHQIVHRDIKPENIMINPDTLQVKIIDFGFAKFVGHEAPLGLEDMVASSPILMTPLGTFRYMPPELLMAVAPRKPHMLQNRDQVYKLDMFAVGVVAYMMLGGTHPFCCRSYNDLPELIEEGPSFDRDDFAHISAPAKDFCARLMNYQAELRPTAKEVMLHPWFQCSLGLNPIIIKQTRSSGCLLEWLREQSCLDPPAADAAVPSVASPAGEHKTGRPPKAVTPPKGSKPLPLADLLQKQLLGVSPDEKWADMSCELDAFCSGTSDVGRLPTPTMIGPSATAQPGSPSSRGAPHGSPGSTENWADMSFDEDSFWATAVRRPVLI